MASYEPPSFSLGLDLGLDSELQVPLEEHPTQTLAPDSVTNGSTNGDEDFRPKVMDSDPETGPEPHRILKRIRRGPPTTKTPSVRQLWESPQSCGAVYDEIEEFSSQDDGFLGNAHPPWQYQSICSSSKIPLRGCRVLTTGSSGQLKASKRKWVFDTPASASLETSRNASMFPKLTISPLRRFQLLDSDSDDPSGDDNVSRKACKTGPCSTERQSNPDRSATSSEQKSKVSANMNQNEDLWKDFCPKKSFCIPTPALDEVCEEYFQSLKDKNLTQKLRSNVCISANERCEENTTSSQNDEQVWNSEDPLPPAHQYFFHDDPRIQKLVRNRLPNVSPLGVIKNRGNQQPNASSIDYMKQFSHEETSKQQATQKINFLKGSTRGRNKSNVSNEEVLLASGGWMDPKIISKFGNGETSKQQATRKINFLKGSTRGRNKSNVSNEEVLLASGGWMDPKIISKFGNGETSRQKATRKINVENRSTKGRNNSKRSKKSNAEEVLNTPGSWVDPKSSASTSKDAGKRRVHAKGESAGHWYTTPDGRRVYVTRSGQELTGQSAYEHYQKESGAGFRKSRRPRREKAEARCSI